MLCINNNLTYLYSALFDEIKDFKALLTVVGGVNDAIETHYSSY